MKFKVVGVVIGKERYEREFMLATNMGKGIKLPGFPASEVVSKFVFNYVKMERGEDFARNLVDVDIEVDAGDGKPAVKFSWKSFGDFRPRAPATEKRGRAR